MGRVKERAINVAPKAGPRFGPGATSAASRAPKRDELRPHVHGQTTRRVMRWAAASAAVIAVAAPIYWAVSSGWIVATVEAAHQGLLQTTAASGFALREVRVEGRGETAVADILSAVRANRGDPILGIDIDAVRQRLEDLPWIETASVERRFPDQLIVSVTEAEPMALWQRSQKLYLVSRDGAVIETANLGKYAKLLIIVGDEAPKKAQDLFDILAQEPELRTHVTAAVLVGKRRWNIRMDNDVDVKLPEDGALEAWRHFADLNRQDNILDKDVTVVDLRQPDRVVVRQGHPQPPVDPATPAKSNET
jgi:cell division protein FtsQ